MKHVVSVTTVLLVLFFAAQVMGLVIVNKYLHFEKTETGEIINVTEKPLPSIAGVEFERPVVQKPTNFVLFIVLAIIIGTVLALLLVRFRTPMLWRLWFFLAILLTLTVAFAAFMGPGAAFVLALVLASLKIFRPGVIVQNFTELFVYGGLAAIFVPIPSFTIGAAFWLLFLISVYDMYAVWTTKHMIKMAKFQAKLRIFAGLLIPYKLPKPGKGKRLVKVKTAVLGGGDIGFPLIFAGVVMKTFGFWNAMLIPPFTTIALLLLFVKGKKNKFYPAMPFISIGCVVGFGAVLLAQLI